MIVSLSFANDHSISLSIPSSFIELIFASSNLLSGPIKILNDEEVYSLFDVRVAVPDQDQVPLKLKAGWNKLLLKIENGFGGYGFYARVRDSGDTHDSASGENKRHNQPVRQIVGAFWNFYFV